MIALVPSAADLERLPLDGGELRDDLHLTLAFLGEAANWTPGDRGALLQGLANLPDLAVVGEGFGANYWNPGSDSPSWNLAVGGSELEVVHGAVWELLHNAVNDMAAPKIPEQHAPWAPHICLAYTDNVTLAEQVAERVGPITFDRLRVAFGEAVSDLPLSAAMIEPEQTFEGATVTADASQPVEHFHYRMAEGVSTGLRTFATGAITWREPPFAFMWQKMIPESGGHGLAVQAGLITRAERSGEQVDFYGPLDLNSEDGLEYARRLVEGFARWGSVSPDENKVDVEVVWADGISEEDMALGAEPEQFIFRSFNVAELTALSVPALADATIEPTEALLEELRGRGVLPFEAPQPLAAAVHTITIPDIPPAAWFEEPPLDLLQFGAVEITDEGRLFGLLAPKNVAHRGFPGRVTAPVGHTDYKEFHEPRDFGRFQNPPVLVDRDGKVERMKAGCLTFAGGHAPTSSRYDWLETIKHYDESESVVARVRIGENEHGVWVAGYVLPDVTPYQLQRMMACQLSGDWRPHKEKPGWYDFAAALFVPVPGFPMAASGVEVPHGPTLRFQGDRLVASAVPVRHAACACPAPLAASGGPDLSRVKELIASKIQRDRPSRRELAAARVKARG